MKSKNRKRRGELLGELREALPMFRHKSNGSLLEFCNISEATLRADCENECLPWIVTGIHYYCLGLRSARARANGRYPDGSACGSENPSAVTPSYTHFLFAKQPDYTNSTI